MAIRDFLGLIAPEVRKSSVKSVRALAERKQSYVNISSKVISILVSVLVSFFRPPPIIHSKTLILSLGVKADWSFGRCPKERKCRDLY